LTVSVEEQKQLEQELQRRVVERTAELEEVQRELESVSYSMVHDMRSPVRAIIATSTELLEEYPDCDPGLRRGLNRQKVVGRRMHALVDGMIQYIRLIRAPLEIQTLDISALCNEAVDKLRANRELFEAKVIVAEGMKLQGDPAVMKILVEALMENATKFRHSDRPNEVWITQPEDCRICITDNGIGFDPIYLRKILLPFERLHREDEYAGVGIGLALARRAVGRHNGAIEFTALVGQGLKVCISFNP
jgi:light-regulated signal transduction histidine kinase (bacteriophytochrome)